MVDDCSNPFNGYYAQIGAGAGRETGSTVIYTDEFHTGDPTSFYLSGGNEGSLVSSIDGSTFAITSSFNGGQWVRYSNPTTNYGSFATDSGSLTCSIQVIVAFLKYWQRKQMVSTRRDVVLVMA